MNGSFDNPPPGVIFDLDGTLADTLGDITESVNVTLATLGRGPLPSDRVRPLVGEGLPVLLSRASSVVDEDVLRDLVIRFLAHYDVHLLDRTRLYAGIAKTLNRLAAANCPMAVLSNKPHDSTQTICERLLADWRFRKFVGATDGCAKKPDPTSALALARDLNRSTDRIVFVGDSAVDVATAFAAGMQPIGVTWGFREVEELRQAGAVHLVDRPEDLAGLILDS